MKPEVQPNKIVVLSGATVSAESGLPTFRDSNGLWNNFSLQDVATPVSGVPGRPCIGWRDMLGCGRQARDEIGVLLVDPRQFGVEIVRALFYFVGASLAGGRLQLLFGKRLAQSVAFAACGLLGRAR